MRRAKRLREGALERIFGDGGEKTVLHVGHADGKLGRSGRTAAVVRKMVERECRCALEVAEGRVLKVFLDAGWWRYWNRGVVVWRAHGRLVYLRFLGDFGGYRG